jgi:hypothetical protein
MSRIILTGGSGYLGQLLTRYFSEQGHEVVVISRHQPALPSGARFVPWDAQFSPEAPWPLEFNGADLVINLAGKIVNCRYTAENKRAILQSRLTTTAAVARAIYFAEQPPAVWMNASSATIYRDSRDKDMDEASTEYGDGFSEDVVRQWESLFFGAALPDRTPPVRRVALRIPIVFGPQAEVFRIYSQLIKTGLGGPQGDGGQYVSWLHEKDFCRAIEFLWQHGELGGPVNLSTPNPLPNHEFMREFREAYGWQFGLWAPKPAMAVGGLLMGTEPELILKSRRVYPRRLLDAGFRFEFPRWAEAVRDIVGQPG